MVKIRSYMQFRMGGLVLLTGLIFSMGGYTLLSRMAEDEAEKSLHLITTESSFAIDRILQPATTLLKLLANVPDLKTGKEQDWAVRLPAQGSILQDHKMLTNIHVGGPAGQSLQLRILRDDFDRKTFNAPPEAQWLMQVQRVNPAEKDDQYWVSMDSQFKVLKRERAKFGNTFDPRIRPWYQAVNEKDGVIRTQVYKFFATGKKGVTLAKNMGQGWVIAMDIRVETLEPELARLSKEQASRIALFENSGAIIFADSFENGEEIFFNRLKESTKNKDSKAYKWRVDPTGQSWWVGTAAIKLDEFDEIQLHVAVPRDKLLAKAQRLRNSLLIVTLLMTVFTLLVTQLNANKISSIFQLLANRARALNNFDYKEFDKSNTRVEEIEHLEHGLERARQTTFNFLSLLDKVARETDLEKLLPLLLEETNSIVHGEHAWLHIFDGKSWSLRAQVGDAGDNNELEKWLESNKETNINQRSTLHSDEGIFKLFVPLIGRRGQSLGLLILQRSQPFSENHRNFVERLSGFAALTLESKELIAQQKQLFESFIKLLAEAVDAKSPHTGGHCYRVPILTEWLVELAASSDAPSVANFKLNNEMREAVHIAAWLHDCGKVVTPEYVVDKATKLETLYDRIHEIRMRFEVCKREAELAQWHSAYPQGLPSAASERLATELKALDDDFAFVGTCNLGSEKMSDADVERIKQIAARTWTRTLDDTLGLSHEEMGRRAGRRSTSLPAQELLLSDQPEHQIVRPSGQAFSENNQWGFKMQVPELLYDRGEVKNLTIQRGTLTDEERYKINEHIVMTIKMLESLPFPRHLAIVPEIAGGHHERTDGGGYPRAIPSNTLSVPARLMAIADVFEALTATDRPYKKGKNAEESLDIMRKMAKGGHLDAELFELFANSDIPARYTEKFLQPEKTSTDFFSSK